MPIRENEESYYYHDYSRRDRPSVRRVEFSFRKGRGRVNSPGRINHSPTGGVCGKMAKM
jgi:hypothetical protein